MDLEPYDLLTSTRYDPQLMNYRWNNDDEEPQALFLLPLHLERLKSAAEAHGWFEVQSQLTYSELKSACVRAISWQRSQESHTAFRLRITVSRAGLNSINVAVVPLPGFTSDPTIPSLLDPLFRPQEDIPSQLRVYVDTEATIPSIFTRTKTTVREVYDHARRRLDDGLSSVPSGTASDVLLYNEYGEVMETTIFNIALYRDSQWVTPSTSSGCLAGVMRRWLLENRRIREDTTKILTKDAVQEGEWVLLFNGVQGCRIGKIYKGT